MDDEKIKEYREAIQQALDNEDSWRVILQRQLDAGASYNTRKE